MTRQSAIVQRLLKNPLPRVMKEVMQVKSGTPRQTGANTVRQRRAPKFVKGVAHDGNYYRVPIPPRKKLIPDLPKLPKLAPTPKPLTPPPAPPETAAEISGYRRRLAAWLRTNFPVIILNIGSLATLVGFTRSDVLELRSLALTGNLLFIVYNLKQTTVLWPPIIWSGLFAGVNAYFIGQILDERNGSVSLSPKQEEIFVQHFMTHGVTPRQFQKISQKAKIFKMKKGEYLIHKGDKLDHVYLIAKGSTMAHVLGRRITAASTSPDQRGDATEGGDSGAWAGEIAFLNSYWEKEQGRAQTTKDIAFYSIVVKEDSVVYSWSHDDMEKLMESSADMRSALTRAMSLAVVGKVVNLTVSRSYQSSPWSVWLKDWSVGGDKDKTSVEVRNVQEMKLAEDQ
mmetsp:Transcript_55801/g.135202  ORF Transcript_55801/g.135202 Transcript_55801/m.135202 type:complete len:397 (+) Transcript_55801:203-1393(+)